MLITLLKGRVKQIYNLIYFGVKYSKIINSKYSDMYLIIHVLKNRTTIWGRINLYILALFINRCSVVIIGRKYSILDKVMTFSSTRVKLLFSREDDMRSNYGNLSEAKSSDIYLIRIYHDVEVIWRDFYNLYSNLKKTSPEIFYTDQFFGSTQHHSLRHISLPDWSKVFFGHYDYINVSWGARISRTDPIPKIIFYSIQNWIDFLKTKIYSSTVSIHHFRITPFLFKVDDINITKIPLEFARISNRISRHNISILSEKSSVVIPTALMKSNWFGIPMPTIAPLLYHLNYDYSQYKSFDEVIYVLSTDTFSNPVLEFVQTCSNFPFKIVYQEGSFNFSRKVNLGVNASSHDNLLIINDDISFITKNVIGNLITHLVNSEIGAVGATLLYENRKIQHLGQLSYKNIFTHDEQFKDIDPLNSKFLYPREVSGVTGALFATRKKYWDKIGGFDENLPENFNDTDFMLRLGQHKSIIIDPRIKAFHKENISRPKRVQNFETEYMLKKHKIPKIDKFFTSIPPQEYETF